jgi:hypothetical protein
VQYSAADLHSGDFTKINIAPDDSGGQLDSSPHTPQGAQCFTSDDNDSATAWVVSHPLYESILGRALTQGRH